MTEFKINVERNGIIKQVKIYVDDWIALLLHQCEENIRQIYLEEEYRMQKLERKETRRHISLEESIEKGHDFVSKGLTPMEKLLMSENSDYINEALEKLTKKQRRVVIMHIIDKLSFRKISKKFRVNKETVRESFYAGIKKLKKFYKTPRQN